MPICINCTAPIPFLYTVYQTKFNLRLEQCTACDATADPYVEHDTLILIIDLILLKLGVYRHLLYNRGAEPRRVVDNSSKDSENVDISHSLNREKRRWIQVLRLGSALVLADAFIRWNHLNPSRSSEVTPWTTESVEAFIRIFVGCVAETIAFHSGIMLACFFLSTALKFLPLSESSGKPTGIRREFRFSLVPLSLLYSSLTKFFLLFLLSIWRPRIPNPSPFDLGGLSSGLQTVLQVLDDDKLDREWVVRNVLGGLSAGFGLRVILDSHPAFTTSIIVAGWAGKTVAASVVSDWVGADETSRAAWLAYSIP